MYAEAIATLRKEIDRLEKMRIELNAELDIIQDDDTIPAIMMREKLEFEEKCQFDIQEHEAAIECLMTAE